MDEMTAPVADIPAPVAEQRITADDIRSAYRLFLNREPETAEIVEHLVHHLATFRRLREAFVSSPEFLSSLPSLLVQDIRRLYFAEAAEVDVDVAGDVMEQLVARACDQWRKLGETEPYWSVLAHSDFYSDNISDSALDGFYQTGEESARLIDSFAARTGWTVKRGICLELGCGVGRVTPWLAQRFDEVVAVDISPGNLAICDRYLKGKGVRNVETLLIRSPQELDHIESFDFFYSVITLQHNAPPVQKYLLEKILSKIRPGGACLFQTTAEFQNYSFSALTYLEGPQQVMDMHCLPQPVVLKLIRDAGLEAACVTTDPWSGMIGSYTYFATRPEEAHR
jgi:SAM-dependent methyltransferase